MTGDEDTTGTDAALARTAVGGAPPHAAPAGERYGHYRLGHLLGKGGMGEVISADDDHIGRSVAIKRMRSGSADAEAVARVTREARIQGQLEHPAIVPIYDLGRDDAGFPVIVMKQLRGTTLAGVLREQRFTRQQLLRAFVDVCLAIEFAHSRGIVHRDLKPSNIMLGDFGEVYVLDWGIARVLGEQDPIPSQLVGVEANATVAGTVMGTLGYMSPEQLRGDPDLDGRADVYALGCVLFEILAGEPLDPPGRREPSARAGTPEAMPSRRAPDRDIPPELDAACVRATMLDRAARYPSARALGAVVERILDGDRDLEQRKKLAAELFDDARAALARGPGEEPRRVAIRAAGRALALDPTSGEIASLVARLMLEPPAIVPAEVERELADEEILAIRKHRHVAAGMIVANVLGLPILYWAGVRVTWFYAADVAIAVLLLVARYRVVDRGRVHVGLAALFLAGMCALTLVGALVLTPLLILPTAIVSTARNVVHRRLSPPRLTWLAIMACVIGPGLLELAGVLPRTMAISGGALELHTGATTLDPYGTIVWLVLLVVMSLSAVLVGGRASADRELAARRELRVQAWQLRQLVPSAAAAAPALA